MTEGEKVILALEKCTIPGGDCEGCPYADDLRTGHQKRLMGEALDLIKSLQEDIEVWKQRYKWRMIERKTTDDPNKEPIIVKVFTTEEMELRRMEMAKYIDADALLAQMKDRRFYIGRRSDPVCIVEDAPAADVEPVRHGHNVKWDYPTLFECSLCGWECFDTVPGDTDTYQYCPNCGAKMDKEEGHD